MRRARRGGGSGFEFASSGEDSFVAVVVTKLTGALLFILLLTMVIMALLPKAVDLGQHEDKIPTARARGGEDTLRITTPAKLPDAIAGRPYQLALAAVGGHGPLHWSASGQLPEWLSLDEATGRIAGTPPRSTASPLPLAIQVGDEVDKAALMLQLAVLPFQDSASAPWWPSRALSVSWRSWLEHGVGFLLLWLVHLVGMNLLANLERSALGETDVVQSGESAQVSARTRYASYRLLVRLTTLAAMVALAFWLVLAPAGPKM
jgi:hypothetical protein